MGAESVVTEWYPGAATTNANDYFINQIRTRMGEYDSVFDHTGVHLFAREHLFKERLRAIDLPVLREQLDNLAQRVWRFPGAQPKDHLFSSRRSVSVIAIGGGEIYWIIRQSQLSS